MRVVAFNSGGPQRRPWRRQRPWRRLRWPSAPDHRWTPYIRPGAASKTTDVITFGLFAKTFYGVSEKDNNFVIDVVMTLKWMDKRVAALIPKGLEELTLSKKESEMKIWLPMMAITNRDIKKYDLISTAVRSKPSFGLGPQT